MHAAIISIGTANPSYNCTQSDFAGHMVEALGLNPVQKKILQRIYKSSGIEKRHSVLDDPTASFPKTSQRMAVYKAKALDLALAAIDNCLNVLPSPNITHVITVSCTGMYAPGLDIEIVQRLNLPTTTQRTSINFMGCYGAFNGLKVANAICRADADATVLLVCVELCSIHIQKEFSRDNIISSAIFADGAAAVLITGKAASEQLHFRFKSFYSDIMPQTSQEMAWHIGDYGFDMVLSAYVPQAIKAGIAEFTNKLFAQSNQSIADMNYFAIHPGGMKILQACEESLNISAYDNRFSYDILRQYGNMSSATVLFVLQKIWNDVSGTDNAKTIFSCAFGPGLTLESMLLEAHC